MMLARVDVGAGTTKVWTPPRLTTETRPDSHIGPFFFSFLLE